MQKPRSRRSVLVRQQNKTLNMAIFKRATAKETKPAKAESKVPAKKAGVAKVRTGVLLAPRVTEKAAIMSEAGTYVLMVSVDATKKEVSAAVEALYKVAPRQVRMVSMNPTRVTTRATGKAGYTNRAKKAYVFLKKGDKIDLA